MDKSKQLETTLALVLGFVVLYWLKRWDGWLAAALAVGFVCLLAPPVARAIDRAWRRLSLLIGNLSSKVLLTLVYILLLLPLSLAAKWGGRSGIRRKPGGSTYFTDRNHTYDKEDLIHPW